MGRDPLHVAQRRKGFSEVQRWRRKL
jgi:hypothetical protein